MKKTIAIVCLSLGSLFFNSYSLATDSTTIRPGIKFACEGAVVKGCVGECGASFNASHVVTQEDVDRTRLGIAVFCLKATTSSLCPNTGAFFELEKNGQPVWKGDLAAGDKGFVAGEVGDVVTVNVRLVPKPNDIVCIRLGETQFKLGHLRFYR